MNSKQLLSLFQTATLLSFLVTTFLYDFLPHLRVKPFSYFFIESYVPFDVISFLDSLCPPWGFLDTFAFTFIFFFFFVPFFSWISECVLCLFLHVCICEFISSRICLRVCLCVCLPEDDPKRDRFISLFKSDRWADSFNHTGGFQVCFFLPPLREKSQGNIQTNSLSYSLKHPLWFNPNHLA